MTWQGGVLGREALPARGRPVVCVVLPVGSAPVLQKDSLHENPAGKAKEEGAGAQRLPLPVCAPWPCSSGWGEVRSHSVSRGNVPGLTPGYSPGILSCQPAPVTSGWPDGRQLSRGQEGWRLAPPGRGCLPGSRRPRLGVCAAPAPQTAARASPSLRASRPELARHLFLEQSLGLPHVHLCAWPIVTGCQAGTIRCEP